MFVLCHDVIPARDRVTLIACPGRQSFLFSLASMKENVFDILVKEKKKS